jgi:hypothetical protein
MKFLKKIILRYRGVVDIDIRVTEIANGFLVNNKFIATKEEVVIEVNKIILNPDILFHAN